MPYLIIRYELYGGNGSETLAFDSAAAAEAALLAVQNSSGDAVTIASDLGETLTMRRSAIVGAELSEVAPPQSGGTPSVDIEALKARLGTPIYEGPNSFSEGVLAEPLSPMSAGFAQTADSDVIVWRCRPESEDQVCMAICEPGGRWRYWPCAVHRNQPNGFDESQ